MKISIIISNRNEGPNLWHTIHSLYNDLTSWLAVGEFEIIVVDQLSDGRDVTFIEGRGAIVSGVVRVAYDPIMGNTSSRDWAVRNMARGDVVFFCDSHMSIRPGATRLLYEDVQNHPTAIVHPRVAWFFELPPKGGYGYSVKLSGRLWGTWNRLAPVTDAPFAVPASGHCFFAITKAHYLNIGGYSKHLRVYGGAEVGLDFKNWLLGGVCLTEPRALVYHLSAGRGYSWHQDDLIHNLMFLAETVCGRPWAERCRYEYLNKIGAKEERINELFDQAMRESPEDKAFIEERRVMTFEELLDRLPWDQWNMERYGKANSGILIYDIRRILKGAILERFLADPVQQKLEEKIHGDWSRHVYKGDDGLI